MDNEDRNNITLHYTSKNKQTENIPIHHIKDAHPACLTYISSTQCSAKRPWSDICSLVVDGQTLNAAHKATICTCRPDQPISIWWSTHIQRGAESDFSVLTLKEQHWKEQNVSSSVTVNTLLFSSQSKSWEPKFQAMDDSSFFFFWIITGKPRFMSML